MWNYVAYIVPEGEDAGFAGVGSRHGGAAGQVQGLGWARGPLTWEQAVAPSKKQLKCPGRYDEQMLQGPVL